jgi:hypothetical protein
VSEPTWRHQWGQLATAALLGTDRRPAPAPPPGPLADAVERLAPADDAESVLVQVALVAAARRGGVRPGQPAPELARCPDDPRPPCPPAAARRLPELVEHWPSLVDEWLDVVAARGYRLPPALAVTLWRRHRGDARRALVERAAGPVVEWITELFPAELGRGRTRRTPVPVEPPPLPADLAVLVALPAADAAAALAHGLATGRFGVRLRASLVQLVGALPAASLSAVADALGRAGTNPATLGLALSLADLARTRAAMLAELAATPPIADQEPA